MTNSVKTLTIRFANALSWYEITHFRGAIIHAIEQDQSLLFHNHDEDGLRYSYPLIQYKRIGGKAAIVCVGDGTEAIGAFFSSCNFNLHLGDRPVQLEIEQMKADKTIVQVWDDSFCYSLRKWLPLNQENYEKYKQLDGIVERCALLEKLLIGNILSFAKGLGITLDKEIKVKIKNLGNERLYLHKSVKKMGMDVEFSCNVSIPDFIGLGQGVSVGYGMVGKVRTGKE